jgi:molecular chaperone HscB
VNHFEVFGLDRKLAIDAAALQRRFYELSRQHHPDFHQGSSEEEQARVLETSARVNAAYRALRDPIARVEYLVRLEEGRETEPVDGHGTSRSEPVDGHGTSRSEPVDGHGTSRSKEGDVVKPKAPPELLEEMFEIQETLQEARSGGLDDATRATLETQRERLVTRRAAEEDRITGELSAAWDAAAAADRAKVLAAFREALATRAYLRTVIGDLGEVLDGAEEGHVTHHRD